MRIAVAEAGENGVAGRVLRILFSLLLLLGAAVTAVGLHVHEDDHAAADWIAVEATVVDLQVRSPSSSDLRDDAPAGVGPGHIPVVVYAWQIEDSRYQSTRFRLGGALAAPGSREAAWAALADYRIGQSLTAYRHPDAPERAVLDRQGSWRGLGLSAVGLVMMALGAFGLWRVEHVAHALRRRPGT